MAEKPTIPTVVVETGTLLTLLLGGKEGWQGYGYAKLLVDMAKNGVIKLATTDMVLGEFMGSVAPLYEEDFTGQYPLFKIDRIPKEFAMREERIALVHELLKAKALTIIKTPAAQEYMERIRDNEDLAKLFKQNAKYKKSASLPIGMTWPPEIADLREKILMDPKHYVSREIRYKGSPLEEASGKRHRGEVSIADAVKAIQQENPDEQIFVLFEGKDDRGIIVQRLSSEKGSENYDILNGKPLPQFDPNSPNFDRTHAATLGNVNFHSTKGFLLGCMYAAQELKPKHLPPKEQEQWYIVEHGEGMADTYQRIDETYLRSAKDRFSIAFEAIIKNVNAKGLPRSYHRCRDRHITQMMPDKENEFFKINGNIHQAPWLDYIAACVAYEKTQEEPGPLRRTIGDFIGYRREQDKKAHQVLLHSVLKGMEELGPEAATAFAEWWKTELEKQVKKQTGRG